MRRNIGGTSPRRQSVLGHSRAERVGNVVHVAGTTATGETIRRAIKAEARVTEEA